MRSYSPASGRTGSCSWPTDCIVEQGTPDELFRSPQEERTKAFLKMIDARMAGVAGERSRAGEEPLEG